MGAIKMGVPHNELKGLVEQWRIANPAIVALWDKMNKAAIKCLEEGGIADVAFGVSFELRKSAMYMHLPSGRKLSYYNARIGSNKFGSKSIIYEGMDQTTKQWREMETYGGKLVENCLTFDTLVLTSSGWKGILYITLTDKLWDGSNWVSHSGIVLKGYQKTIRINGVGITPNHRVLTTKGWQDASQGKRYYRVKSPFNGGSSLLWLGREKITVDNKMRLWKRVCNGFFRILEEKAEILWLSKIFRGIKSFNLSRAITSSSISCVAVNEESMSYPDITSLEKLRRPGNNRLRKMVGELQKLLGGYVSFLSIRINSGENRCERKLFTGELYVGFNEETGQQYEVKPKDTVQRPYYELLRGFRYLRNRANNLALPIVERRKSARFIHETGHPEQVCDIANAGPLRRFTVKSENGEPFIVHNCVQAIARDCLAISMQRLSSCQRVDAPGGYDIVFHVHDEVIIECSDNKPEDTLKKICDIMGKSIPWAPGLLLKADGYFTKYYKKD